MRSRLLRAPQRRVRSRLVRAPERRVSAEESSQDEAREIAQRIRTGDRRALARAITRIESSRDADRARGEAILEALIGDSGNADGSYKATIVLL